jgi:hypothetical protein
LYFLQILSAFYSSESIILYSLLFVFVSIGSIVPSSMMDYREKERGSGRQLTPWKWNPLQGVAVTNTHTLALQQAKTNFRNPNKYKGAR